MDDALTFVKSVASIDACHIVDAMPENEIVSLSYFTAGDQDRMNALSRAVFKDQTLATAKALYAVSSDAIRGLEEAYDQTFVESFDLWLRKRGHAIRSHESLHQEAEELGISYAEDINRTGRKKTWKRPESEAERNEFLKFSDLIMLDTPPRRIREGVLRLLHQKNILSSLDIIPKWADELIESLVRRVQKAGTVRLQMLYREWVRHFPIRTDGA